MEYHMLVSLIHKYTVISYHVEQNNEVKDILGVTLEL